MTRKEEIKQAAFNNDRESLKENQQYFIEGAEWSDENPDEKMIAKYLYEKKGYPIDLNGHLPSFEETMKDVEKYNKYKEDKFIEKAEKWLDEHILDYVYAKEWGQGVGVEGELFDDFKTYMKGE